MTISQLYRGVVRHTRLRPVHHAFRYRVYYGLFDVDEIDGGGPSSRFFSNGRLNLLSIDRRDHGPCDGSSLRVWAEAQLAAAGIDPDGGRIALLAFPRVLGYVFDPISVWYCRDRSGRLIGAIHEVRNTFGDRHSYVVPMPDGPAPHDVEKRLHVSPFMDMNQSYRFTIDEPGDHLSVAIDQSDADGPIFRAGLALRRVGFTDGIILRLFVTHPLVTLKAITAIHLQAFALWRKGVGVRRRPEPPVEDATIVERATS